MEIFALAEKCAIKKLLTEYNHDRFLKDPAVLEKYLPKSQFNKFVKYCSKRTGGRYKYILVTINWDSSKKHKLEDIIKRINKINKKKWIDKSMWCFEWRNGMNGFHTHMKVWVNKDKKKVYNCKREIYNTVKNFVGNKMHVNCRYSNIEKCFENYLEGWKEGVPKDNNKFDVENRKKLGLKDMYLYNGSP